MIVGIGTDMIEIDRVIKACEREYFLNHVFTKKEIDLIQADKKKSASNFAVKEAVVKALGVGFGKIRPIEIEVLRDELGRPYVYTYGEAERLLKEGKTDQTVIHVSLTNTKKYASAFVVLEQGVQ